ENAVRKAWYNSPKSDSDKNRQAMSLARVVIKQRPILKLSETRHQNVRHASSACRQDREGSMWDVMGNIMLDCCEPRRQAEACRTFCSIENLIIHTHLCLKRPCLDSSNRFVRHEGAV